MEKQKLTEEQLRARIDELERLVRKREREISRLSTTIEQQKIFANAKANQTAAQTFAQRMRDRYLLLLLNNSPNFIICFDSTRRIIFSSAAFLKLIGESDDSITGKKLPKLFKGFCEEKDIALLETSLNTVFNNNESHSITMELSDKEWGKRKFIINFTSMLSNEPGNEGAIAIFQDVTEIEAARENAERSSVTKSEFLSNMSHEMRTPLNAIIGMTAIAKDTRGIEHKDYCLSRIERASAHLLGVINDILDMSKIEANKLELSCESFCFEEMIQKVVTVINFRVEEKNQNLTVKLDEAIPYSLIGDDQRLSQVITNLLSNAIKFTPEKGTIRLNAKLAAQANNVYTVQIQVTDSGIGISPEHQERLFNSFQQADSSTSRKFGGTGLGLAISKRLVEMMGGSIWVKSEHGKGAAFTFTFLAEQGQDLEQNCLNPEINWKDMRVLVVNNAPKTLEYVRSEAARLHVSFDVASSGEEALKMIAQNGQYDIYFIDGKIDDMDCIEVARRINALSHGLPAMVFMITATKWSLIEEEANKAGVTHFLQKPLFHSDIVDCLNKCFDVNHGKTGMARGKDDDFSAFRILLVEDVEINREIVLALLEPTNLLIECAVNGAIAVEMVRESAKPYDMIFMDVQMPEMDGYEATRKIREYEKQNAKGAKPIPIIAMTANVFKEDVDKCREAGMNDHLGKPLDFDKVLKKLRMYLLCD